MPQADLMTFHTLVVLMGFILLTVFSFVYFYLVPLWSTLLKVEVKTLLGEFVLDKLTNKKSIFQFKALKKNNFLRWINNSL